MTDAYETLAALCKERTMHASSMKLWTIGSFLVNMNEGYPERQDAIDLLAKVSSFEWEQIAKIMVKYGAGSGKITSLETMRVFEEASR